MDAQLMRDDVTPILWVMATAAALSFLAGLWMVGGFHDPRPRPTAEQLGVAEIVRNEFPGITETLRSRQADAEQLERSICARSAQPPQFTLAQGGMHPCP